MNEFKPQTLMQKEVMEDTSLNLLFHGPWGTGKTLAGAAKAYIMAAMYPGNCVALVRKKRVDLKPTLWKWFTDKILPPGVVVDANDTELYRKILNGSEIYGIGLDSTQDVNKLASREYGFIVVEEARETDEQDFDEKIIRCLRLPTVPFHQVLLLTNPSYPSHYLYQRFIMEHREGYRAIQGTILPNLPPSYYTRLSQLRGIYRERYVLGKWTSFEGLVYPFDPQKHIIKSFPIPKDGKRIMAIDFGFDHPFICQWWYIDPSDRWYMYREIYHSQRTVNQHSKEIKKFCELDGFEPVAICDHDAEDAATLRENGINTIPAQKDRLAGQQVVYDKFVNDQVHFFEDALVEVDQRLQMEGKPIRTVDEFSSYVWANLKTKEDMVKQKDDGMDTMRYAIYTEKKQGGPLLQSVNITDLTNEEKAEIEREEKGLWE